MTCIDTNIIRLRVARRHFCTKEDFSVYFCVCVCAQPEATQLLAFCQHNTHTMQIQLARYAAISRDVIPLFSATNFTCSHLPGRSTDWHKRAFVLYVTWTSLRENNNAWITKIRHVCSLWWSFSKICDALKWDFQSFENSAHRASLI